jgi:hypothetical protein
MGNRDGPDQQSRRCGLRWRRRNPALERDEYLAGERHCPPEDVGRVPGYEKFLEVIFDAKH